MRALPLADPGIPDLRSPTRFLTWIAKSQRGGLALGAAYGMVWMTAQAVMPAVLGRAMDAGVTAQDPAALATWSLVLLTVGMLQAGAGVLRHRNGNTIWLAATYRVQQLLARQAARLGAQLPRQVPTGEVVAISGTDAMHIGAAMEITARAVGAAVSFAVVAALLLTTSVPLGLVVLVGMPMLMLAISPLLRPLHHRQLEQRRLAGDLSTLGADTVAGLRVLRGIGGEEVFVDRYRVASQRVRVAGVSVARVGSVLDAAQIALPGAFVVLVMWLGARLAATGTITPGELIAFYGYAAFLVIPLRTATEAAETLTKALVGARRAIRVLALVPELKDPHASPGRAAPLPTSHSPVADPASGLVVRPGRLTAVVSAAPEDSTALLDRLGRYVDSDARLGAVPLSLLPLSAVRQRILVSDKDPRLFTGTLREQLDPTGDRTSAAVYDALTIASAHDVLEALPDGLHTFVEERGRGFSGGQRQRLVLARALLADPEILILDEPTSAVDAHTEARIAARLGPARRGRTTVVATSSPLVLDRVDHVAFLADGRVIAEGRHRELLQTCAAYRRVVTREEDQ